MRGLIALLLASAASIATPAAAQVATNIVPDAGNAFDVGTIISQAGNVTTIDGGTIADSGLAKNIFHSFALFDLGNGDVARWETTQTDPGLVANVISRVTGGVPSFIEGTIDSTALPNASFYFINPSGIVFGAGAMVDVPGISVFSTASSVDFFGSEKFSATTADGSTFSVANPQAFGFLGQQANIILQDAIELVAPGAGERRLSLYAANVGVFNSSATATEVDVIAVGQTTQSVSLNALPTLAQAPGEIFVQQSTFNSVSAGQSSGLALIGGLVTIDSSIVSAEASADAAGGFLVTQADSLTINNSLISTSTATDQSAGGFVLRANSARITGNSSLSSNTSGAGNAGLVLVLADALTIEDSSVKSDALFGSTGFGGNVIVGADQLTINNGFVSADSFGEGNAGNVFVTHNDEAALVEGEFQNSIVLTGGSFISSDANGGSFGNAGNVTVNAGVLQLFDNTSISSDARFGAAGNAGSVEVNADVIEIFSANTGTRAAIRSDTSGDGFAGSVTVNAGQITLGRGTISSNARPGSTGNAGFVEVNATRFIDIFDNGFISSDTSGAGFGGDLTVTTGELFLTDNAFITSDANEGSTGTAGAVAVTADAITISDFAFISSDARPDSQGDAGFVTINAGTLLLDSSGAIRSNTSAFGRAGDVFVTAGSITARNGGNISTSAQEDSLGDAGFVSVNATDLRLENGGFISSDASIFTLGNAGFVTINAKTVALSGGSAIRSNTASFGNGGNVSVTAETVSVTGSSNIISNATADSFGNAGHVQIEATRSLTLDQFSSIASDTFSEGFAGNIIVTTPSLSVRNNAFISSDANPGSTGDAGFVSVSAADAVIADGGFISSDASGAGLGGNVTLVGKTLRVASNGRVSAQANAGSTGDAGIVSIVMDSILIDRGRITSTALPGSAGFSGFVDIKTGGLTIQNGGTIETSSANANIAGQIDIEAGDVVITGAGSGISSENSFVRTGQSSGQSGQALSEAAAGDIFLTANTASLLQGGSITTNSASGPAGAIFITLPQGSLLLLQSTAAPSLITTSSGPGTGGVISIAQPLAIVSNGGSILAKGQQGGADVAIRSSFFIRSADRDNRVSVDGSFFIDSSVTDVSSGTAAPATDFLDASRVLSGQCASARASGETSVLSVRKVGPYALPGATTGPATSDNGGCL